MKNLLSIFSQFFLLGLVSFGGPVAHIGYFHKTFVQKLAWITEEEYASFVSLSQLLPGPGSSQVGFAIGLHKAGWLGGLTAFLGFTLPSFFLMYMLAVSLDFHEPNNWLTALIHGLKLLAVVVVFDAILSMYQNFCASSLAKAITLLSAVVLIFMPLPFVQIIVILMAAMLGIFFKNSVAKVAVVNDKQSSFVVWPVLLFIVLFALSFVSFSDGSDQLLATFYQSGSLVFGGGHVVLPLLQANLGDSVSQETFLFGYAAAQGIPGPMFTLATFLGASLLPNAPLIGAILATVAIFMPGFLLVLSFQGAWQNLLKNAYLNGAVLGINASVVGLLIAAFYNPIWVNSVYSVLDLVGVLIGVFAIRWLKLHILWVIVFMIFWGFMGILI